MNDELLAQAIRTEHLNHLAEAKHFLATQPAGHPGRLRQVVTALHLRRRAAKKPAATSGSTTIVHPAGR